MQCLKTNAIYVFYYNNFILTFVCEKCYSTNLSSVHRHELTMSYHHVTDWWLSTTCWSQFSQKK